MRGKAVDPGKSAARPLKMASVKLTEAQLERVQQEVARRRETNAGVTQADILRELLSAGLAELDKAQRRK